jgi:uncharacterized protein (DUF1810 family)
MRELERFVAAQQPVVDAVLQELRAGRKRTHWMWFVFPQLAGLGHSAMARHFAIADLDEARRYLAHPVLGPRLVHCTELVNGHAQLTAHSIFGSSDDLKFRSSMTLFREADAGHQVFQTALDRFYGGKPDERTLALLAQEER